MKKRSFLIDVADSNIHCTSEIPDIDLPLEYFTKNLYLLSVIWKKDEAPGLQHIYQWCSRGGTKPGI